MLFICDSCTNNTQLTGLLIRAHRARPRDAALVKLECLAQDGAHDAKVGLRGGRAAAFVGGAAARVEQLLAQNLFAALQRQR